MPGLEHAGVWPEIVRRREELPLTQLAALAGVSPGEVAAALVRTGVVQEAVEQAEVLPPEPGERRPRRLEVGKAPPAHGPVPPSVRAALGKLRAGSKDHHVAAFADLLGRVPDAEVARRAGVSIRTIASFRARHAIPGYTGPRRAAARPPPTVAASSGDVAWRVVLRTAEGEVRGVVVAADLAQAASRAEAAADGEVVSLERLGPVLG